MTGGSLQRRLTVALGVVLGVAVLALAWCVTTVAERAAWRQFDDGLDQRARAWSALIEHDADGYEMELPPAAPGARAVFVEVWCEAGPPLARVPAGGAWDLPRLGPGEVRALTLPDGRRGRARGLELAPRAEDATPAPPCRLVLAEGSEDVERALASTLRWAIAIGGVTLALALLLARQAIARGLRPLVELGAQLEAIDGRSLHARIELPRPPAELAAPVAKLNLLLERLERAFAREREFTADVSHELRTPLAGLRTSLEVTALTAGTVEAHQAAIAGALAIVADLTRLVENLLALARAEAGQLRVAARAVGLRALVDELWALHAPVAAARRVGFDNQVAAGVELTTDRALAAIVIGNLLANAAAYTEADGWIRVTAGAGALVTVTDSGPAIAEDDRARVFVRLWRGDAARSATGAHAGIGLPLARSIAHALGWEVELAAAAGPVAFRVIARPDPAAGAVRGDGRARP